ncbi:MAG: UDP-3-O-acylglucosamine N-acyltransferase [Candidatus Hydrogenedentota bacterium]
MDMTLAEIAQIVGGTVVGDGSVRIHGLNGIREARNGELTFVADSRYGSYIDSTQASAILVSRRITCGPKPLIQVDDPRQALLILLSRMEADLFRSVPGIHPSAVVDKGAQLGRDVTIGAHAVISEGAKLGDGVTVGAGAYVGAHCRIDTQTIIKPNVTILDRVEIGARCILHSGSVIGADGFGFVEHDGVQVKVPQVGTVVIGDDVEIGANTCIDRATFGATRVGSGSKIDNLVQIGHNVQLGRNAIVCGNAGIAGSTLLGDNVIVGAGAGLAGHIEIGEGAKIAGYSGVTKSVPAGATVFGYPAVDAEKNRRMQAALRQLPDTLRRIRHLEQRIAQLEGN